jgi:hypothetical protein
MNAATQFVDKAISRADATRTCTAPPSSRPRSCRRSAGARRRARIRPFRETGAKAVATITTSGPTTPRWVVSG